VGWRVGSAARYTRLTLFTAWVWLGVAILAPILWVRLLLARDRETARRAIRWAARAILRVGRCRVDVAGRGEEGIAAAHPAVIVANHASYLDVVAVLSVLPINVRFAAKARLASYPLLGTLLRRAGYLLVQRGAVSVASDLAATLAAGESLFIFPEGTFMRAPGVMPFRLGAFQAAVETGRPIVPVALRGTRAIFPDETLFVRTGDVTLTVGDPLVASGAGWPEMVRLRDQARTWVAEHAGEPPVSRGLVMVDAPE
jgi:1-acyl-sn-glycerol-3-phosphate acyltransferase